MGMLGQHGPTLTVHQQRPTIHPQTPPPQTNTVGIPVYRIGVSAIQELLAQATATAGGGGGGGLHREVHRKVRQKM